VTPSLYDLLNVDESASTTEIRAAWKAAIADLDPTDRRFRAFNQAAETLLDPERRTAYDVELAAAQPPEEAPETVVAPEPEPESEPEAAAEPDPDPEPEADLEPDAEPEPEDADLPDSSGPARLVPIWLLAVVCVCALAAIVAASWVFLRVEDRVEHRDQLDARERGAQQATEAAEEAAVPVLSYDYRRLEADIARAAPYLTDDYADQYREVMAQLSGQATKGKLVVAASTVASGIVRSGDDRAEILVYVNQDSSRDGTKNDTLKMWVTMTMVRDGDAWLIDKMKVDTPLPS
jgi:Mce-associated membrane protein